ncbi:MAG: polysaccharide biosynthesis/export family protein [Candidatus Korobacteraceae bacterium]
MIALMVLALAALPWVYAQDSSTDAKPVLPASNETAKQPGNNVAKATALPATDTPATRVANVHPDTYIIGDDDVLAINVWKEAELSKTVPVRPDGMITLPLVGEIKAVGLTPLQLQDQIVAALQKVMSDPQVTVMVSAVNSMSYNIVGQVAKPGFYSLTRPMTVLDAIALCGGFRDFAKQKKIYVLRTAPDGTQERLKFNYKQVIKGKNMAQNIQLLPHDTLVVP